MMNVKGRTRQVFRTGGFVAVTASMLGPFVARQKLAPEGGKRDARDAWVRAWARTLLRVFAIDLVVDGTIPARSNRGRLVVANHRSAIDIGVLLTLFGGTMVSRADLAKWPLVGAAARAAGTVFVDRSDAKSGALTVRAIQNHLASGETIVLFPEGTTFDGDEVRPFHAGAFVAAIRAEAEIVPVGLAYPRGSGAAFVDESFLSHLGRMAASDPTRMVASIGAPLPTTYTDRAKAVTQAAQDAVADLVRHARTICEA